MIRKFLCYEHAEGQKASYTKKTDLELHEACSFSFIVVRSDGQATKPFVYRGENAMEVFLKELLELEKTIREILAEPKPITMKAEDWEKHKNATECHICNKSLIKEQFLDLLPVWNNEDCYCGQSHKKCFYTAQRNESDQVEKVGRHKRQNRQMDRKKGSLLHLWQVPRSRAQHV